MKGLKIIEIYPSCTVAKNKISKTAEAPSAARLAVLKVLGAAEGPLLKMWVWWLHEHLLTPKGPKLRPRPPKFEVSRIRLRRQIIKESWRLHQISTPKHEWSKVAPQPETWAPYPKTRKNPFSYLTSKSRRKCLFFQTPWMSRARPLIRRLLLKVSPIFKNRGMSLDTSLPECHPLVELQFQRSKSKNPWAPLKLLTKRSRRCGLSAW